MEYDVKLDSGAGRDQTAESLTVTWPDGREDTMRLHEYTRVYGIPGLYEEVVQNRLDCLSPQVLTDALMKAAADDGKSPADLRVFDLGAGNGVMGGEIASRGVETLVGSDNIPEARDAAERDRPGLYTDYLVGDINDLPEAVDLVRERELNALVAAGALGLGHITAVSFDRLWSAFPSGSLFSVSIGEDLAGPGDSDFGDYLAEIEGDPTRGKIVSRERFRHRLLMNGDEVHYFAVVVRKA
jgi:hypothetical protein